MVIWTSLLTGLFSAMLRSLVALVLISWMICLVFAIAYIFFDAPFSSFLISLAGFNLGLILYMAAQLLRARLESASH
jgi:ABC-type transport system involved in multi-copper enzyme maturation permease subunit